MVRCHPERELILILDIQTPSWEDILDPLKPKAANKTPNSPQLSLDNLGTSTTSGGTRSMDRNLSTGRGPIADDDLPGSETNMAPEE